MSIIDNLINDFIDEHKVLPNALLVKHSTVVSEDFHHAIDNVQNGARGYISLTGRHEVNSKLLREEVVHPVHVLHQAESVLSKSVDR